MARFLELVNKLARPATRSQYGKGYTGHIPDFIPAVEKFLATVTAARMPMELDWHKLGEPRSHRLLGRLKARLGIQKPAMPTHILVPSDELAVAAQGLHDRIFRSASHQSVLLNQAGSGWNPVESTKYFNCRKVVLVTRDPRDQFAELKQLKKARDVGEFVKWYRALQSRIVNVDENVVLKLLFEEFVTNNDAAIEAVCEHFGLSPAVPSSYEARLSEKNIGKYRAMLTRPEAEKIEEALLG